MTPDLDLKAAEREAFTVAWRDGILDLSLGASLLAMGLALVLEPKIPTGDWWAVILAVPLLAVLWLVKHFVTTPRIGVVRFAEPRRRRLRRLTLVSWLLLAAGLLAGLYFVFNGLAGGITRWGLPELLWAFIWLAGMGLAAYTLDLRRLYLYGVVCALALPVMRYMKFEPQLYAWRWIPFVTGAAIMLIVGFVMFVRFMRSHPHATEEPVL